jgi:hypothetical protein
MTPLFKKLNYKTHKTILALNSPASFEPELAAMAEFASIIRDQAAVKAVDFVLCFVTTQVQIDQTLTELLPKLEGDAVLYYCYPKGTSKNYKCDFNRDTGWVELGKNGLESVRMVAVDADWSALRFRKVEYVKTITRRESFALTDEAKRRTTQKGK